MGEFHVEGFRRRPIPSSRFGTAIFFDMISIPIILNIHPVPAGLWTQPAVQPLTDAPPKRSG